MTINSVDTLLFEREMHSNGVHFFAGVDEVGRGCLAGPVFAAAVILPKDCFFPGLTDSKKLTAKKREYYFHFIQEHAISIGVGSVPSFQIDQINILQATKRAMLKAISNLSIKPEYLLIDGKDPIASDIPQKNIIKGDLKSHTIAAASVIAKVLRDQFMVEQNKRYPCFNFDMHKGYGTVVHFDALKKYGMTNIHRRSFLTKYPNLKQFELNYQV